MVIPAIYLILPLGPCRICQEVTPPPKDLTTIPLAPKLSVSPSKCSAGPSVEGTAGEPETERDSHLPAPSASILQVSGLPWRHAWATGGLRSTPLPRTPVSPCMPVPKSGSAPTSHPSAPPHLRLHPSPSTHGEHRIQTCRGTPREGRRWPGLWWARG